MSEGRLQHHKAPVAPPGDVGLTRVGCSGAGAWTLVGLSLVGLSVEEQRVALGGWSGQEERLGRAQQSGDGQQTSGTRY